MKKLLSLIIALFFVICELNVVSVALYDETDCLSVSKFTSAFVEMVSETENEVTESVVTENADVYFSDGSTSVENQNINEDVTDESIEKTNRLIVKASVELDPLDAVGYVFGYNDLHILQFDNSESFEKAYEYYDSLECVEYVEEDAYLTEAVVDDGNDVVYESAIEYPTISQSNTFGYSAAKSNSDGNTVSIGVIDSGVQHDHEFLKGRVVDTGFNSISDNGTAYDDRGHGTHVAGIIVSNTLSNVTVYSYKALNKSGSGTSAQVSLAIDAAIEDGMDVLNLSVQMKGFSDTLHEAVQRAYNAGVTVVAAAGNAGVDIAQTQYSPGCFEEVISVMSCSIYRRISDFSNYGTPCDFAAPGEEIFSTYLDNTYKSISGTSMASPFICAAVAYELAKDNTLTPAQVQAKLEEKIQYCFGSPAGKCVYPGAKVSFEGTSSAPVFLYDSCNFAGSLLVSLSCNTEDVEILYSFDGERFLEYTEPFYITKTASITAYAISKTLEASFTRTVHYTCLSSDPDEFVVDENNVLVAYNGTNENVIVPTYINEQKVYTVNETAFANNINLKNISFDISLNRIDSRAFAGCTSLESITARNVIYIGEDAFNGCRSLRNIYIDTVYEIGDRAFNDCTSLLKINTERTERLGTDAFKGCSSLLSFSSDMLKEFDLSYLSDCISLECLALNEITTLPELEVGKTIESYFPALKYLYANKVTAVPVGYFKECMTIEHVEFYNATSVGDYAFYNSSLKTCVFNLVKTIGIYSFANTDIDSIPFGNLVQVGEGAFYNCQSIISVALNNLTTMGEKAFYNCTSNEAVHLPKIKEIPAYAFYNNTSLKSVYYLYGHVIGERAFMNCSSLTKVSCGSSQQHDYKRQAFYGCSEYAPDLKYLYPTKLGSEVFVGTKANNNERVVLEKLTSVEQNAFNGLQIESLVLENIVTLNDVPKDCLVLVGSKISSSSLIPSGKNATIYSRHNTTLSNYCKNYGIKYVEYNAGTAILDDAKVIASEGVSEIAFDVIGFDVDYTMYGCNSNVDSTSLVPLGAVEITNFTQSQSGKYFRVVDSSVRYNYYFIVASCGPTGSTSKFFSCRSSFVSLYDVIDPDSPDDSSVEWFFDGSSGDTKIQPVTIDGVYYGDFLVVKAKNVEEAFDAISVVNGIMNANPSIVVGDIEIYGTGTVLSICDNSGNVVEQITLVLSGDINGDGVADAIDCARMADCMYDRVDFVDGCYYAAADINGDGILNVIDYQMSVNSSVL